MNRLQRRMTAMAAMAILVVLAVAAAPARRGRHRREHPRPDDHRARALPDPGGGHLGVHEGHRRQGQLRRHRLGRDALQARRREHRAHLHRRRGRVRLVVHGPVRRRQVGRAARGPAPGPLLADLASTGAAFKAGGKTYAACSRTTSGSRSTTSRCSRRRASPSSRRPLTDSGRRPRSSRPPACKYPLSIPWRATEGGVTPWYLLTLANGRPALRQELQADVPAARLGRLQGAAVGGHGRQERLGLARRGLARRRPRLRQVHRRPDRDPARHRPGQSAHGERPEGVDHRRLGGAALVPGATGPSASFGLPEGSRSRSPRSTRTPRAAFIKCWKEPANPNCDLQAGGHAARAAASVDQAARQRRGLAGGKVLGAEFKLVQPLFPQGAPKWYSQFSSAPQGLLNSAVKGDITSTTR